jgi:hypothetical protein
MCNGCLVVHRDGAVAYCSQELDDGLCSGYETVHEAGILSCSVAPRKHPCRYCHDVMRHRLVCAPAFVPDGMGIFAN